MFTHIILYTHLKLQEIYDLYGNLSKNNKNKSIADWATVGFIYFSQPDISDRKDADAVMTLLP